MKKKFLFTTILCPHHFPVHAIAYFLVGIICGPGAARSGSSSVRGHLGCFPLCQRFWKFRLELKWKGPFRFLPTGIFGITSGGGPLISVGIFRSKFAVPFLRNRFFALIREFGNDQEWQELFLLVGAV